MTKQLCNTPSMAYLLNCKKSITTLNFLIKIGIKKSTHTLHILTHRIYETINFLPF